MKEKECAENLLKELEYNENTFIDFDCFTMNKNDYIFVECDIDKLIEEAEKLNFTIKRIKDIPDNKKLFGNFSEDSLFIGKSEEYKKKHHLPEKIFANYLSEKLYNFEQCEDFDYFCESLRSLSFLDFDTIQEECVKLKIKIEKDKYKKIKVYNRKYFNEL